MSETKKRHEEADSNAGGSYMGAAFWYAVAGGWYYFDQDISDTTLVGISASLAVAFLFTVIGIKEGRGARDESKALKTK